MARNPVRTPDGFNNVGDQSTASNLGSGAEVFAQKVGDDLQFRTLVAGASIQINQSADEIEIAVAGGGGIGEDNTAVNVGGAAGEIFRNKTGVDINLRTLNPLGGLAIVTNADTIDIDASGLLAGVANIGGGAGVFDSVLGQTAQLRSLVGVGLMSAVVAGGTVEISTTAENNDGQNVGTSTGQVYRGKTGQTLDFKTIGGAGGVSVANGADDLTIDGSGLLATASNIGGGAEVFDAIVAQDARFRTLVGLGRLSAAQTATEVQFSTTAELNVGANVGGGVGEVYRGKTGETLDFKTLVAGGGVSIVDGADTITIDGTGFVTGAVNIGAGAGLFAGLAGQDLEFRSLIALGRLSAVQNANDVTFSTTAELNSGANVGTSVGEIYRGKTGEVLDFKSIGGANGISVTNGADDLTIDGSGLLGTASNLGAGAEVFSAIVGQDAQFRTVVGLGRLAAAQTATEVELSTTAELNSGANVGGATGEIYRGKTGEILDFKTLLGAGGVAITNGADTITIDGTGLAAGGVNLGAGAEVFAGLSGQDLEFRSLIGAGRLTATQNLNDITFSTTAELNDGANVGTSTGQVYRGKTGETLDFKSIGGVSGISVTNGADDLTVDGSGLVAGAANLGAGAGVFDARVGQTLNFLSLVAGPGISITPGATEITISNTNVSAETWATTLAAGNVSGGTDPTLSNGDNLLAAGVSDIGAVGSEFRDLHLDGAVDFSGNGLLSTAGVDRLRLTSSELEPVTAGLNLGGVGNEFGGLDLDGYITQLERSSLGISAVAGSGYWWVRDDTPSVPIFTDDAGTDHNLLNPPGTQATWADVLGNGATSGGTSPTLSSGDDLLVAVSGASNVGTSSNRVGRIFLDDQISLSDPTGSVSYIINKNTAGTYAQTYQDGGNTRWNHVFSTGENLQWDRYDSGGVYQDTAVMFSSGGPVLLNHPLYVGSLSTSGYPTGTRLALGNGTQATEYISFDTTAAGVAGLLIGDTTDNDEGRWLYNMAGRWDMWVSGAKAWDVLFNAIRPGSAGSGDIGSASLPVGDVFIQDALRFTGTTGIIGVDGTDEIQVTANAVNFSGELYSAGALDIDNWSSVTAQGMGSGSGGSVLSFRVGGTSPGGIYVGTGSGAPDTGRFYYLPTNVQWQMWLGGVERVRWDGSAMRAITAYDIGATGNPFRDVFLSDTLAFTGTTGRVSVNGTDNWTFTGTNLRPVINDDQAIGNFNFGLTAAYFAPSGTPATPSAAEAAVYVDGGGDDRIRTIYSSAETRRLDQAPALNSFASFDGTPEIALNWFGNGLDTVGAISGSNSQRAEFNFVAPYDCRLLVHCYPTDAANDSFGTVTCRIYEGYNTGAAVDSDAINWNAGPTGMRTYSFATVFSGDETYGITLQPSASDTSSVIVFVEIIAV